MLVFISSERLIETSRNEKGEIQPIEDLSTAFEIPQYGTRILPSSPLTLTLALITSFKSLHFDKHRTEVHSGFVESDPV
jgi:hypothetical protein